MADKAPLYSLPKYDKDYLHVKLCDEQVMRRDYITLEHFSKKVNAPLEDFEKHLRTIEEERRVAQILVMCSEEDLEFRKELNKNFGSNETLFVGEYDDEMKERVNDYIAEKGFSHMRKSEGWDGIGFHYACILYDWFPTLGFYYRRVGLLRGSVKDSFDSEIEYGNFTAKAEHIHMLGEMLRTDYIQYLFGDEAVRRLLENYRDNFLNNFEYGTSLLNKADMYEEEDE